MGGQVVAMGVVAVVCALLGWRAPYWGPHQGDAEAERRGRVARALFIFVATSAALAALMVYREMRNLEEIQREYRGSGQITAVKQPGELVARPHR